MIAAIHSEEELDDLLSAPSDADCAALRGMTGGLVILGAGGKMGPTLARRARRAADEAGAAMRIVAVSRFSDHAAEKQLSAAGVETIRADLLDPGQSSRGFRMRRMRSLWRGASSAPRMPRILHGQ